MLKKLSTTDMNQLKNVNSKDGKSIYDKLIKKHGVKSLVTNGNKVNNKKGDYQIVKISTDQPMPKEVSYLTHSSAGILV
ncbi:RGD-containing lipoprotein [Staphylococcus gallinarum]|uniref:RGD-containing lipoprotein n=1 Tax=Staphylococcus gallinarum TaxID=1293 RepID=A0A380F9L4_STAGA|nr:RGD-containing lipoprotein [Staphylococcus gallinarum]